MDDATKMSLVFNVGSCHVTFHLSLTIQSYARQLNIDQSDKSFEYTQF